MDFTGKCRYCDQTGQKYKISEPKGWIMHMSRFHKGFTREEAREAGVEAAPGDVIKGMSGFRSLEEVQAAAPEQEGGSGSATGTQGRTVTRSPRLSKEEQEKLALQSEFERLRPLLLRKWERRLRTPYSLAARLANDPKIQLTDEEAADGAEMHVDFMQAMGWLRAGKIEAIADLVMWHGTMILGRSDLGSQLLADWTGDKKQQETKGQVTPFKN